MAPSWSELPSDLLGVVLLHLRCLADRVYFGAVCRSWRSATAHAAPPPQLPWLLLVPSAGAPCFVSLLAGSARRRISLPHGARLYHPILAANTLIPAQRERVSREEDEGARSLGRERVGARLNRYEGEEGRGGRGSWQPEEAVATSGGWKEVSSARQG